MMYNSKFVVAIKSNGKILREFKDIVYLPFGSEYSVYVKNLNSVRAQFNVEIDGSSVGPNFIVGPNESVEIERFVKDLNQGNRFKFIQRSEQVENHRGIKAEDGIIRVGFQFEKVYSFISTTTYWPWDKPYYYRDPHWNDVYTNSVPVAAMNMNYTSGRGSSLGSGVVSSCITPPSKPVYTNSFNDSGITAPGSISEQKFSQTYGFALDSEKHSIVLKLLGDTGQHRVSTPVTVEKKATCTSCGRRNKIHAKFCSSCGTSLQLVA